MKPVLDPKRDLAGATPETLAKALFKPLKRSGKEQPKIQKRVDGNSKGYTEPTK